MLLVSGDAALAARLRRALPARGSQPPALQWVCAASLDVLAADPAGWQLILLDVQAAPPLFPPVVAAAIPVLWLGQSPLLAAGVPPPELLPGPIVDYLDRQLPASKLAFILQQHLAALHWRELRRPRRLGTPARPQELHAEINNTLTGLLGNAVLACEWAHEPGRRLPPPFARRLQCIAELAGRMRELVDAAETNPAAAP